MKYNIVPINEVAMKLEAGSAEDAIAAFATKMDMDMSKYFKAIPLNSDRKCSNCILRMIGKNGEIRRCLGYERAITEWEEIDRASECCLYEKGTPGCMKTTMFTVE